MPMKLNESAETYLETILLLSEEKEIVRSVDIAHALEYSKPSVSIAIKQLRERGFLELQEDGGIKLTKRGKALAKSVYEKHSILTSFLVSLGVEDEQAANDACRIEHVISDASFNAIRNYMEKL